MISRPTCLGPCTCICLIAAASALTNRSVAQEVVQENASAVSFSKKERAIILGLSPPPALPVDPTNLVADHPAAARLGQFLFFDRRLSQNGQVSCSTCHDPAKAFTDGMALGRGVGESERHTTSLWNVAYNRWFFWDGRADTLWSQAMRPLESPRELGTSRLQIAHLIRQDESLRGAYEGVFGPFPELSDPARFPPVGRPVSDDPAHPHHQAWLSMREADQDAVNRVFANVGKSIAAYERRIISRDSSFDRFVQALRAQERSAVSRYPVEAQRGLKVFIGKGNCRLCHSGANLTDGEFHDTRLPTSDGGPRSDAGRYAGVEQVLRDPFNAAGVYSDEREGPAADKLGFIANSPQNWGLFKTPTLRNVALTAPYMHHGRLATLRDVVAHYSNLPDAAESHHPERILIRLNLSESDINDLVAFLESLTDASLDADLLSQPASPQLGSQR